jgi:hypothetical protein
MTTDVHPLSGPQRERGPLDGIGIVVTRPLRQAAVLAKRIASLGGALADQVLARGANRLSASA